MARIEVKRWWYEKEQLKAQNYDWTLCWEKVFADESGNKYTEKIGKDLYNAGKVDIIGFALFGDTIKETEKAVQVQLSFWNLRKAGRYVTDAPVEKRWKTWIPKSVLL